VLVAAATAAAAGAPLHGAFTTVIKHATDSQLDGTWRVRLLATGHYTIDRDGTVLVRGRDTETATTITFGHETGPAACTGPAAGYKWSFRAGLLHLTELHESCYGRHIVLTTHPLLKTG